MWCLREWRCWSLQALRVFDLVLREVSCFYFWNILGAIAGVGLICRGYIMPETYSVPKEYGMFKSKLSLV